MKDRGEKLDSLQSKTSKLEPVWMCHISESFFVSAVSLHRLCVLCVVGSGTERDLF